NSPGGDMFEGLAIYNLLREHEGEVNVKVLGLAASAGSVIAMAGDTVQIARAGFLMIHNAWVVAMGNRNDLRELAAW
ncbi:head maturation protease, ClpP-related, partial [Escherichia coli]|uniref:head maturation protease, ClpP-related n=2 Tax=Pseudomonadota TaxID=1224 RepID=UPI0039E03E9B